MVRHALTMLRGPVLRRAICRVQGRQEPQSLGGQGLECEGGR